MKRFLNRFLALAMMSWMVLLPPRAVADDIDLFVGASTGASGNSNVLLVFDNTSNWSRNNQHFVGISSVGAMEAGVAATVVSGLTDTGINIGVMEYVTKSGSYNFGGFVRSAIKPMNVGTNQAALVAKLNYMAGNVNDPDEKLNSNIPYGGLMHDIYNYLSGSNAWASPGAIPNSASVSADEDAYVSSAHTQFKSPLSCGTACAKTFVIVISNPDSNGPASDSASNTTALQTAGGNTNQLPLPNSTQTTSVNQALLGNSSQCYSSQSACNTAVATSASVVNASGTTQTYNAADYSGGLSCGTSTTNPTLACTSGSAYRVTGITNPGVTYGTWSNSACVPSASCAAPANTPSTQYQCTQSSCDTGESILQTRSVTQAWGSWAGCGSGASNLCVTNATNPYQNSSACTLAKPADTSTQQYQCAGSGSKTMQYRNASGSPTYGAWSESAAPSCTTSCVAPTSFSTEQYQCARSDCTGSSANLRVQHRTITTTGGAASTDLGVSGACYASESSCSSGFSCPSAFTGGCSCASPQSSYPQCGSSSGLYSVYGNYTTSTMVPTGTSTTDANPWNADEWSRFLYQRGISFGSSCDSQKVVTYTIDVTNNPTNKGYTPLLMSMASVGGGKYFMASSNAEILASLSKIFQEIQSVNSTFASASLPVSATNRSQNQNQVYIGMFRPDPLARPRWFGNLKRYQFAIAANGIDVEMVGSDGVTNAINNNTGFVDDCAMSFWTKDSRVATSPDAYYWSFYGISPTPTSRCSSVAGTAAAFSDYPDGPDVGKGGAAQMLRSGNSSAGTVDWTPHRNVYTTNAAGVMSLGIGTTGLDANQQAWTGGADNYQGEPATFSTPESMVGVSTTSIPAAPVASRASVHGDVVHSRPLPVTYSSSSLVVYYGANDGVLRAVDSTDGREIWGLVPDEFSTSTFIERLRQNDPVINYSGTTVVGALSKPYGWDGSIGLYQTAANDKVWIYPTQRRGGRYVYGLNVTTAASPSTLFRVGCNPGRTSCTTGFSSIGQTWSMPNIAKAAGYTSQPVAFFGGGYDPCEDENNKTPSCSATTGNRIYAVNANDGTKLAELTATGMRASPADVSLVDADGDGKADYGYAVDTGGNLYRLSMVSRSAGGSLTPLDHTLWTLRRVAYTQSAGRKFLHAPALLRIGSQVYVAMGSGDREHPLFTHYPCTTSGTATTCDATGVLNRFYVYIDDLTSSANDDNLDDASMNQTTDHGCDPLAYTLSPKGWYIDLKDTGFFGEQTVTSALIAGGSVMFSTNRPKPPATGVCSSSLGEAWGYTLNLKTASGAIGVSGNCGGSRGTVFVGGGLPPSPVIGTVMIGNKAVTVILGAAQKSGGVSTPISPQKVKPSISPVRKRIYWKQSGVD